MPPTHLPAADAIHHAPIAELIDWLLELARRHGEAFRGPDAWLARQRYQARHPTAIAALKCMDGRINLSVATQTPAGILMPFRNLGGMFNLGWPHLGEILTQHVMDMVRAGRRVLVLITYHWSRGDPQRGCAGFHYNRAASQDHAWAIRAQLSHLFGHDHATVYPLVCGFETDQEALVLHSTTGATLDLAEHPGHQSETLEAELAALLPDMPAPMRADLLPLLRGNLAHIAEVRARAAAGQRELAIEHREWVICLGRGFDFLHTPNLALIVGPYSPDLAHPPSAPRPTSSRATWIRGASPTTVFCCSPRCLTSSWAWSGLVPSSKPASWAISRPTSSPRPTHGWPNACTAAPRCSTGKPGGWNCCPPLSPRCFSGQPAGVAWDNMKPQISNLQETHRCDC
jgi:hypothetical protein